MATDAENSFLTCYSWKILCTRCKRERTLKTWSKDNYHHVGEALKHHCPNCGEEVFFKLLELLEECGVSESKTTPVKNAPEPSQEKLEKPAELPTNWKSLRSLIFKRPFFKSKNKNSPGLFKQIRDSDLQSQMSTVTSILKEEYEEVKEIEIGRKETTELISIIEKRINAMASSGLDKFL